MALFNLHQIYFNEASKANCFDFTNHYENKRCTPYFENSVILDLIEQGEHKKAEYFGVLSHSWNSKTHMASNWTILNKEALIESINGYDLLSFNRHSQQTHILNFAEAKHPGFKQAIKLIFDRIGFKYTETQKTRHVIYSNHFILKSEMYEQYVNELLKPAIEVMEDREFYDLQKILWRDSGYYKKAHMSESLRNSIGKPYYPYHTFLCERFISLWLNEHPEINCKHW